MLLLVLAVPQNYIDGSLTGILQNLCNVHVKDGISMFSSSSTDGIRILCIVILSWAPHWHPPIYSSTLCVHPNPHCVIEYLDTYPSFNCSGKCLRISVCRCVVSVLVGLFKVIFDVASVWNLRVGEYGQQDVEIVTLQIAVWAMVYLWIGIWEWKTHKVTVKHR